MTKVNVTTVSGSKLTLTFESETDFKNFLQWYGADTDRPSSWQPNVFSHKGDTGTVFLRKDRIDFFVVPEAAAAAKGEK